ncbi:hypothetical protein FRC12_018997 [Ceratobasidium sp. 428]|nr:hypothetical protein FRC12_018997 [Ceratobasidium sp. 428]
MGYEAPCYYPHFISSVNDYLDFEEPSYRPWRKNSRDVNPSLFARDTETERVVKLMLQDLGLSNASHIELDTMGERFMCGRCYDSHPDSWHGFVCHVKVQGNFIDNWHIQVWHFMEELEIWDRQGNTIRQPPVRHQIELRNVHDIEAPSTRPLVQFLSEEKASKMKKAFEKWSRPHCYLCEAIGWDVLGSYPTYIIDHLRDRHSVTDPVKGIHYGDIHGGPSELGDEWYEKWDAYHDSPPEVAGA